MDEKYTKFKEEMHPKHYLPSGKGQDVIEEYEKAHNISQSVSPSLLYDLERFKDNSMARNEYFLHIAEFSDIQIGDFDRQILECQVNLDEIQNEFGYSLLHCAVNGQNLMNVIYLLEKGINVNAVTKDGWTALHCACRMGNLQISQALLSFQCNPNIQSSTGITPLHLAVACGNAFLVELLLFLPHLNTTLKSNAGETAYDIAYRSSAVYEIFQLVEKVNKPLE